MSKLFNTLILTVIAIFLAIILFFTFSKGLENPFRIKSKETVHNLILERAKSLGKLELATFYFKDIVEKRLQRDYLPDPTALIIVYGEAIACIDLTMIGGEDISFQNDSIFVKLPKSELCSYKIDHSKTHIYDASYSFMNEKLLFEEAYKSAENKIKESALEAGILTQAETNAKTILVPILENISGKTVVLR